MLCCASENAMPSEEYSELKRSAIYLNNAGSSLLERGYKRWAMESFQVALGILECIVRSAPLRVDVDVIIKRTIGRMAQAESARHEHPSKPLVNVVSFDSAFNGVVNFIFQDDIEALCVFNIEEVEDTDDSPGYLHNLISSIMLSNYAVAHMCLAQSNATTCPPEMTLKLLYLALAVLGFRHTNAATLSTTPIGNLLTISSVLHTILQVYIKVQWSYETDITRRELSVLKHIIGQVSLPRDRAGAAMA